MIMRNLMIAVLLFSLAGCASMGMPLPGDIDERRSTYDNSAELYMTPAWSGGDAGGVLFSLLWRSAMNKGDVTLEAIVNGIQTIPPGESLFFKIDGEEYKLVSFDSITDHIIVPPFYANGLYIPGHESSSKRYNATTEFLAKVVNGKDVRVKLYLDRSYIEGSFCNDSSFCAKQCFARFIEKMNTY